MRLAHLIALLQAQGGLHNLQRAEPGEAAVR